MKSRRFITRPEAQNGGNRIPPIEALEEAPCPLWVKSGHMQCKMACPLYLRKRTCAAQL